MLQPQAAEVEAVQPQRFRDQRQRFVVASQAPEDGGLERSRLVVMPVAREGVVQFLQGVVQAPL